MIESNILMKSSLDKKKLLDELLVQVLGTEHEAYLREMKNRYVFLLEKIADCVPDGGRILDAGASPGLFTELMRRCGCEAVGVDLYPDMRFPVATGAEDTNLFSDMRIPVVKSDIVNEPLPFSDNSFDAVMMNETIEHLLGSPLPCLKEIRRVLKPTGLIFLTTPNVASLSNRIRFMSGRNIYTPVEVLVNVAPYKCHNREYTMSDMEQLAGMAGLDVVEKGFYNFAGENRGTAGNLMRRLYYAVTALMPSFRSNLFIAARPGKG